MALLAQIRFSHDGVKHLEFSPTEDGGGMVEAMGPPWRPWQGASKGPRASEVAKKRVNYAEINDA